MAERVPCERCGYEMVAEHKKTGDVCPRCGRPVDSKKPWPPKKP